MHVWPEVHGWQAFPPEPQDPAVLPAWHPYVESKQPVEQGLQACANNRSGFLNVWPVHPPTAAASRNAKIREGNMLRPPQGQTGQLLPAKTQTSPPQHV